MNDRILVFGLEVVEQVFDGITVGVGEERLSGIRGVDGTLQNIDGQSGGACCPIEENVVEGLTVEEEGKLFGSDAFEWQR